MEWLSTAEAAARLGVSDVRVRQLAAAGKLHARRHAAGWLVAEEAVEARRQLSPSAGRPLNPENAWLLLMVLADASQKLAGHGDPPDREPLEQARTRLALRLTAVAGRGPGDLVHVPSGHGSRDAAQRSALSWRLWWDVDDDRKRSLKRALHHAVRSMPAPERWGRWLARRSENDRYWVHPGVIDRLRGDDRLSLGGAWAAAMAGVEITPDDKLDFYVREINRNQVVEDYRLQRDPSGTVTLRGIPGHVPDSLAPQPPEPVAPVVAALDMLESPDVRSQQAAKSLIENLRALVGHDSEDYDETQQRVVAAR